VKRRSLDPHLGEKSDPDQDSLQSEKRDPDPLQRVMRIGNTDCGFRLGRKSRPLMS
jgi:hypothetical protein